MKNFIQLQWNKYKSRKSKAGIVLDFLFLLLLIAMINPTTRTSIKSFVIRHTMSSPKESKNKTQLGQQDYDWRYRDLQGQTQHFADLKGKVIFLNLWATWCPPCVAELGSIDALYQQYHNQVEFVLISNEKSSTIQAFFEKKGYHIPAHTYMDEIPRLLYSKSIPATYIISKKGEVVVNKKGAAQWDSDKSKALLEKLIAE
ncbi:TlpA family protein disulfide reductase [Saccharicrinis fermentans]|uniref:Thiol-disulfide oxidoreductase ResA n=1 Tax=Saccharicrinis fermentans DSM 9555 = JCM 21142 TaxID=869213 RepID=W7Y3E6_9BACT|nr:TlpA disulfide reductase family protein [Saccharicrinis fermentans]GAF05375.1 thiol-disulfide oxidoreductase ResA [Saccharicrinis fermentans DSM 9555 = JCM 21142]